MNVTCAGRAMPLSKVPAGSVFGDFHGNSYIRLIKTSEQTGQGTVVISLGPTVHKNGRGPYCFDYESDELVIAEEGVELSPKVTDGDGNRIDPAPGGSIEVGHVGLAATGQRFLCCRNSRDKRVFVDIDTGETHYGSPRFVASYLGYVLTAPNELGKRSTIYDGTAEVEVVVRKFG